MRSSDGSVLGADKACACPGLPWGSGALYATLMGGVVSFLGVKGMAPS